LELKRKHKQKTKENTLNIKTHTQALYNTDSVVIRPLGKPQIFTQFGNFEGTVTSVCSIDPDYESSTLITEHGRDIPIESSPLQVTLGQNMH
jgi:hypothetical protein